MRERGPRVLGEKRRKEKEIFQENKNTPWFFDLLAAGKTADHAFQILFAMHRKPPPSRGLDTAGRVSRKTICMASSSSGTFSLPFTILTSRLDFSYDYKKHAGSFQWRTKFYPVLLLITVQSFWRFAVEWEVCSSAQSRRESG